MIHSFIPFSRVIPFNAPCMIGNLIDGVIIPVHSLYCIIRYECYAFYKRCSNRVQYSH